MSKIAYTGGTFDTFHSGHINFLRQCKAIADHVVVSLNTDEFIENYKGKGPVYPYEERESILLGCKYVDEVVPNIGGRDSKPAILRVKPNFVIIGSDWAGKDYYKQMQFTQKWLDKHNIVLVYVPYTQGISSTEVKERLIKWEK